MIWRPWGELERTLRFFPDCNWYYVGCISCEERSTGTVKHVRKLLGQAKEKWIVIKDVESRFTREASWELDQRKKEFISLGGNTTSIKDYELFEPLSIIQEISKDIIGSGIESIFLDITSLPKRFFFPIVRDLIISEKIVNLICSYTTPDTYTDEDLAENYDTWENLPGFGEYKFDEKFNLVVSVGFMAESLSKYLLEQHPEYENVKLLVPFPAPPEAIRRTWASIEKIEERGEDFNFDKIRVETLDVSSAFERLLSIANSSDRPIAFAPFGPKPISLAMCLYAIKHGSPVYYPQPKSYSPYYTRGIRWNDPQKAINSYIIKLNGVNLYDA